VRRKIKGKIEAVVAGQRMNYVNSRSSFMAQTKIRLNPFFTLLTLRKIMSRWR
jgi:hypothetical protein